MALIVEFGNAEPHEFVEEEKQMLPGPAVTRFTVEPRLDEEGNLHPAYKVGTSAVEMLRHFAQNPGQVKHLGGNELVHDLIGLWERHSDKAPTFVCVVDPGPYDPDDMEDLERFIAEYWDCERGHPDDLEATHVTQYGKDLYAPGEAPATEKE